MDGKKKNFTVVVKADYNNESCRTLLILITNNYPTGCGFQTVQQVDKERVVLENQSGQTYVAVSVQ